MPSVAPEEAPLVKWSAEAFRLIPSRFPPVNVYEGVVANDRHDEVVTVENITNPRLRSLGRLQHSIQGDPGADPKLQNWNLAPFAYGNPEGSTFFGEDRPCLEVALERQTALAVSVAKRQSFMAATQEPPIGLDMRMLCTPVKGTFWDLRDVSGLSTDFDETQRREIGAKMPDGAQGILYRPVERPAGACIAIVTGDVLRRSQQTVHYRYVWDGKRIAVVYAFDSKGTPIEAETLRGQDDVLAAA
jgi:hypothetical protein